ncbi:hypothetical protein ACO22_05723 [Paracoccidioides brasiliensis]|uniref:Uncharacterized protein n=1 Tax=Paracoccidioides brasiliensis TaxID=121759 RepID=A0A1D2J9F9_PARBR|nr:hypothetical protein ACO22_05723 [Paracoccidioides brasiliensis]
MRQVSTEALHTFDFIPETYRACGDDWRLLADRAGLADGSGPEKITTVSERSKKLHRMFSPDIYRKLPHNLNFLSDITQGAYFLSNQQVAREEIGGVSKLLGENEIYQENTRWLQAGISYSSSFSRRKLEYSTTSASQLGGDNAAKVEEMCACLEEAKSYAANPPYEQAIERDIQSFATGRTEAYRDSQELCVKDMKPAVETILRFVEPYRDPYGVRAEFEGLVGGLLIQT